MDKQIAFSFDKITLMKIGRGLLISATGAAAIAILTDVGALHIDNTFLASMVSLIVPTAVNAIKEWMAGQDY